MRAAVLIYLLMELFCVGIYSLDCEVPIRNRTVLSAWQSSNSYYCFHTRDAITESLVLSQGQVNGYKFIHSGDRGLFKDGGFHWFAVQLIEPVLIRSVTVKGVEGKNESAFGRSVGIEIWTSDSNEQLFSGDHCNSRNMSTQFRKNRHRWRLCGVTANSSLNIGPGENFTVNCVAQVQHLLLRRNVTLSFSSQDYGYLSASDVTLQTVQLAISTSSNEQIAVANRSFSVWCSLHCNGSDLLTNSSKLQLCEPNGSCNSRHELRIDKVQPRHSGVYSCRLGSANESTSISVLSSSPKELVVKNQNFSVNCWLHKNDTAVHSGLELCQPDGSCNSSGELQIFGAKPQHSGTYTCRVGSTNKTSKVDVLSSSPDTVVEANQSFNVSCSLYRDGTELSTNSHQLQLCHPNGSCLGPHKMQIDRAKPEHAGTYSCQLNSTRKSIHITVLYPPSNVSISVLSSNTCQHLPCWSVQFTSGPAYPEPKHKCEFASPTSTAVSVRNLTSLSQNSIGRGSVSLWQVSSDEKRTLVNCSAVQNSSQGIWFYSVKSAIFKLQCKTCLTATTDVPIASTVSVPIAASLVAVALCIALLLAVIIRLIKQRLSSGGAPMLTCLIPMIKPANAVTQAEQKSQMLTSGVPAAGIPGPSDTRESGSDCTLYLEIVASGL